MIEVKMDYPCLKIVGPDSSSERIFCLNGSKDQISIGREGYDNDISLPDPERNISRNGHCHLEKRNAYWWLVDTKSANGTLLLRGEEQMDVQERLKEGIRLRQRDIIRILQAMPEEGEPIFWQLQFYEFPEDNNDEGEITKKVRRSPTIYLEYSLTAKSLSKVNGTERQVIDLTVLERNLVEYMAQCNRDNDSITACDYEDLIKAIWREAVNYDRNNNEVNHLVYRLRRKIEPDPGEPKFLQTVAGYGYRLQVKMVK